MLKQKNQVNETPRETRSLILDKALTLFAAYGFDGVSMRTLARDVGINPATLYHHFRDKKALYDELLESVFGKFATRYVEILSRPGPAYDRMCSYIREFCVFASENTQFLKLVKRTQLDGDSLEVSLLAGPAVGRQTQLGVELMQELRPDLDSVMAFSMLHGVILHHYETQASNSKYYKHWDNRNTDPENVANLVIKLFLNP